MDWALVDVHPCADRAEQAQGIADKQPQEQRILIFAENRRVWARFIIAAHKKSIMGILHFRRVRLHPAALTRCSTLAVSRQPALAGRAGAEYPGRGTVLHYSNCETRLPVP